jgi:hypothetical protein
MFHIQQTTTVIDYVERFATLFDQLKAYQPNPDLHYYTTRFVDGLREDIRVAVTMQRPSTLDIAYTLALLQEEVAKPVRKQEFHRLGFRGNHRQALPLPRPSMVEKPIADKPLEYHLMIS